MWVLFRGEVSSVGGGGGYPRGNILCEKGEGLYGWQLSRGNYAGGNYPKGQLSEYR